jgi:8-oxo-dGTP diphosphatase
MGTFNIRVYGILKAADRILVSDEIIKGKFYTKFPGGGLEFGEGTRECLQREFKEETGLDVSIGDHLYTTDFFQPSAFHSNHQIISIYYWVNCKDISTLKTTNTINEFSAEQLSANVDCEVFRWIPIKKLSVDDVSLPIDKIVVEEIIKLNT